MWMWTRSISPSVRSGGWGAVCFLCAFLRLLLPSRVVVRPVDDPVVPRKLRGVAHRHGRPPEWHSRGREFDSLRLHSRERGVSWANPAAFQPGCLPSVCGLAEEHKSSDADGVGRLSGEAAISIACLRLARSAIW
jgi:hypothetical protein